jgi:hypothetical protein
MFGRYKELQEEVLDLGNDVRFLSKMLDTAIERIGRLEAAKYDEKPLKFGDFMKSGKSPSDFFSPKDDRFDELLEDIRGVLEEQAEISDFFKVRLEIEHL